MPDVAGTALVVAGRAVDSVVSPKLREYLLGPAFKALGGYVGEGAEAWIARRKAKAAERTARHVQAAERVGPGRSLDDLVDDIDFDAWAEGASQVDDEVDPELAAFWRAALVAIRTNDGARQRLLGIVRRLDADDAIFLASSSYRRHTIYARNYDAAAHFDRLRAAGVVETFIGFLRRRSSYAISIVVAPLMVYVGFMALSVSYAKLATEYINFVAIPASLGVFAVGAMALLQAQFGRYRLLTADGVRLLCLLDRVKAAEIQSPGPHTSAGLEPEPSKARKAKKS